VSAVLLAVLIAAALGGACGGGGAAPGSVASAKTQDAHDRALNTQFQKLALQDKAVEGTSRLSAEQTRVALNRRRLVEAIRRRWEQRGIAVPTARRVVRQSSIDICAPIGPRGGTLEQRIARRVRELQRKQALYYLNLSCPSPRSGARPF